MCQWYMAREAISGSKWNMEESSIGSNILSSIFWIKKGSKVEWHAARVSIRDSHGTIGAYGPRVRTPIGQP